MGSSHEKKCVPNRFFSSPAVIVKLVEERERERERERRVCIKSSFPRLHKAQRERERGMHKEFISKIA